MRLMDGDITGKAERFSRLRKLQNIVDGSFLFRLASFFIRYLLGIPAMFLLGKLVYHLRIKGRHNFRDIKGAMIAANHCQFIEPGFAMMISSPRKIMCGASEKNVTRISIGWLTRLLGAFGIPNENPLSIASYIKETLRRGLLILFYPEGKLSWRSQTPGPFSEGFFLFAMLNNVPVLPLTEVLHERPIRRILPWWPPRTTFVLGAPVYPDHFKHPGLSRRKQIHLMSEHVRSVIIDTIKNEGGCETLPERRGPN